MYDSSAEAPGNAKVRITANLGPFVEMGLMDAVSSRLCMESIQVCLELDIACAGSDLVVEAIVEDLAINRNLY